MERERIVELGVKLPDLTKEALAKLADFTDDEMDCLPFFWPMILEDKLLDTRGLKLDWLGYEYNLYSISMFNKKIR